MVEQIKLSVELVEISTAPDMRKQEHSAPGMLLIPTVPTFCVSRVYGILEGFPPVHF